MLKFFETNLYLESDLLTKEWIISQIIDIFYQIMYKGTILTTTETPSIVRNHLICKAKLFKLTWILNIFLSNINNLFLDIH